MAELIDRYATIDAIPAPTDADEAEYYGKVCDAIEAMPTIPDIDRIDILRLLDEADDIVSALYRQGANKYYKCKSLHEKLKAIGKELTGGDDNG
jgi:hypothetical protein